VRQVLRLLRVLYVHVQVHVQGLDGKKVGNGEFASPAQVLWLGCCAHLKKKQQQKEEEEQVGIYHIREGIGHSHQPAGQVEGELREWKWREEEEA
jgi:hypothetical protein